MNVKLSKENQKKVIEYIKVLMTEQKKKKRDEAVVHKQR